jgi:hypothetical protein
MTGRMPVSRNEYRQTSFPEKHHATVKHRHDFITTGHAQCTAGQEVVLDIYYQQGVG